MFLKKDGTLGFIQYEFDHGTSISNDFIAALKKNPKLPFFLNSIQFIQKCYHSFGDAKITNQHIHEVYQISSDTRKEYHVVEIPKRSGGSRKLMIPSDRLKYIQSYILKHMFTWYMPSKVVMAYVPKRGIRANALPHVKSNYILKLDIHDFFGSIHFRHVVNHILPKELYPLELRTLLANLCMVRGALPQGAPTSPMVSNVVMHMFDTILLEYCIEHKIKYTRYADDMTFSSIEPIDTKKLISKVKYVLHKYYQMELNDSKTVYLHDGVRQEICGVVVNHHAQVSKKYRDSIRQEMYYLNRYGVERHIYALYYDKKINELISPEEYYIQILGKINHVLNINPEDGTFQKYRDEIRHYLELDKKKDIPDVIRYYYSYKTDLYLDYASLSEEKKLLYCLENLIEVDENDFEVDDDMFTERIFYDGVEEYFKGDFKEFMEECLDVYSLAEIKKNIFSLYSLFRYYLLYGNEKEVAQCKGLAERIALKGDYRALTVYAINLLPEGEQSRILKICSEGQDGAGQYYYAQELKEKDPQEYIKYMLASADNHYFRAYYPACLIYEEYGMKSQALHYLLLGIQRGIEDCLKLGKKYKEEKKYRFSKKIAGILNRYKENNS